VVLQIHEEFPVIGCTTIERSEGGDMEEKRRRTRREGEEAVEAASAIGAGELRQRTRACHEARHLVPLEMGSRDGDRGSVP